MFQKYRGLKPTCIIPENTKKSSVIFCKQMTKVLLVEDDSNIATIYKIKFEHAGIEYCHAVNGLEAFHSLKTFMPDMILLDLKMPVMDGETFLHKMRKISEYADIPVIVLTNLNKTEAPKTLWHLGISAYVVKAHTTPSEIVLEINQHLSKGHSIDNL